MLSITLEPQYEKVWLGENPSPNTFRNNPPLLHQWLTRNAEEPLIINTYNTGTGKTKAALLRLLKRAQDIGFHRLNSAEHNALLIAPTNELLAQHARDAEKFCEENKLPYQVVPISRALLESYKDTPGFSEGDLRRGAALHSIIQNHRRLSGDSSKRAILFVVNPDIFYYALYFCYHRHDRIPLFQDFLAQFNYIIIDEFHYYNPKQFANFLFFMSLSKHYGFLGGSTNRQFCLLTATPSKRVQKYLEGLQVDIAWIQPDRDGAGEPSHPPEVPALAPVTLEVYSAQDLQDGLLTLADEKRKEIVAWLDSREDEGGAIISSALWRINRIYSALLSRIPASIMGRLTGAESNKGRKEAQGKRLILATPTVDIGYNFDRAGKKRQNIDFLLFDARSSDEFIQRLGRAGRVLGKEIYDIPSRVLAVVNPELYEALKPYDGQTLNRLALRKFVEDHMPARHGLYAYIQSGAIAEAFRPFYHIERMTSAADKPDLEELFNKVKQLFAARASLTYKVLRSKTRHFEIQDQHYRSLKKIPVEMTDCLKACEQRLRAEQEYRKSRNKKLWTNAEEAYRWLQEDLRAYFTEKARFSFRESFQPPLALVSDTQGLLSSEPIALYDALHIAKNYRAKYFKTLKDWEQQLLLPAPESADDALVFCDLIEMRESDERLRIGLKLFVGEHRKEWEERFVYRSTEYEPTALYGLQVIALNSSRGLDEEVEDMFKERYIPAFVAAADSRTAAELWNLQRQGQCFPYKLEVTFADLKTASYYAVLGTMALLVWAILAIE
jgi:CRISPR-associated endonuclease/helicase Cas3